MDNIIDFLFLSILCLYSVVQALERQDVSGFSQKDPIAFMIYYKTYYIDFLYTFYTALFFSDCSWIMNVESAPLTCLLNSYQKSNWDLALL